ncbi:hypothetical protein FH966_09500 [Lentibacillus cibarius]|uniref:Cbb3-type cytochrome c oxidase subunit I n=1 Tax=Lentibacillus cibarius TaxID=2583219 RepID=A0A549YJ45_9BACI|nr:hypothetical protein [Lentibacillus cibarius]TRM11901.1 hypothetical protein FH966_09500 [Lentibacillus cibarius]
MVGGSLQSNTNIKLPLAFILYALAAFVVAQIVLLINSDLLTMGHFRVPDVWMGAHFLLLGYAVMIAMGAMYQLVPVALLTPIWNQTFGFIQLIVTAVGITAFSILLGLAPNKALYGGVIAVIGVLMFIIQMGKTINKQEQKNMMTAFILGAIIFLSLTIVAGFLLAWNLSIGGIASHGSILSSHITFGVAGWFSLLIFGFSYKLVPMFSLSHGYSMKWAKPAFFTYMTGLVILIASFWAKAATLETIGWIGMLGGFFFFVLDIREILTKRMKKKLDKPFSFSMVAIMNGLGVHVLAFAFSVFGIHDITVWGWLIFLYVMGWIVFSILGYLYKIVPFLWWTYKYANKIGQEKVPTLKEMIDEKTSVILFTLFIISTAGLTVSGLLQINITVFLFQGLLTLTSLLYVLSIIRVLAK